jgi:hypothetical protein
MENLNYLAAAYLVFWLGPLALVAGLWRRQATLQREIDALRRQMNSDGEALGLEPAEQA